MHFYMSAFLCFHMDTSLHFYISIFADLYVSTRQVCSIPACLSLYMSTFLCLYISTFLNFYTTIFLYILYCNIFVFLDLHACLFFLCNYLLLYSLTSTLLYSHITMFLFLYFNFPNQPPNHWGCTCVWNTRPYRRPCSGEPPLYVSPDIWSLMREGLERGAGGGELQIVRQLDSGTWCFTPRCCCGTGTWCFTHKCGFLPLHDQSSSRAN